MTKNSFDISLEELAAAGKSAAERADAQAKAAGIEVAGRVAEVQSSATVVVLGAHLCKWPIGDPAVESFRFCGRRAKDGLYCAEHASIAYQPSKPKRAKPGASVHKSPENRRA